jgi:cytochrome c
MTDRFNTFAGWLLASGIVALGLSSISSHYFRAGKDERPETMGYPIAGAEEATGPVKQGPSFDELLASADPAAGKKVFAKCMACHTIDQGAGNGIGPNLYGVVGEAIGQGAGGFAFSDALSGVGGKWNFDELDKWLTSPKAFAPGTKMTFAGLPKTEDRANVIAYLNSMGSNLPLPKPAPKADASAAPAKEDAAK